MTEKLPPASPDDQNNSDPQQTDPDIAPQAPLENQPSPDDQNTIPNQIVYCL